MSRFVERVRGFFEKFRSALSPLVTDSDGLLSIGRISFWSTFGAIHYHWYHARTVPESLVTVLMALMAYEIFKKGRDVIRARIVPEDANIFEEA